MTESQHLEWTERLRGLAERIDDLRVLAERERVPYCRAYSADLHDCLGRWVSRHAMATISDPASGCVPGEVVKPQGDPDTPRGVFSSGNSNSTKTKEN